METVIGTDIALAVNQLMNGNTVAIPTETVYGLAANALDGNAVAKIFEAKNRPYFDPLIIHVKNTNAALNYVNKLPASLQKLATAFWPGPLTLLLDKKESIPDIVTAGLPKVAVRVPAHTLTQQLLEKVDFPLAAPSANPFGYVSPTTAEHVFEQLQGKIPYILNGGACTVGVESTIVGEDNNEVIIYRLGGISIEAIEAIVGKVTLNINTSSNPASPGSLATHYAPQKKIVITDIASYINNNRNTRIGVISFNKLFQSPNVVACEVLSTKSNLNEAAQHLFAALRNMDKQNIDVIISELFPDEGLGKAINDRLKRASAK